METVFKESLFDYDGPFLFIVQNGSDQYMAVKIRQNNNYKYIVVPVLEQQIREAKMGKKSVDDIFMKSTVWFLGRFSSGRLHFELEKQESSIELLSEYFDGTFYLDPEDYEDNSYSIEYNILLTWTEEDSLNTEQIELELCDLLLKNHSYEQWLREDLMIDQIISPLSSPWLGKCPNMKQRKESIQFFCDNSCSTEMQPIDSYAA